jgi:membrane protease YdiL (CAAX protease family)
MAGWYLIFMTALTLTKAEGIFADEFAKWLWFIIVPLILLFIIRGGGTNIRTLLRSVGFHRQGIGKALLVGLLSYAVMIPSFPFMLPYAQLQKLEDLFHTPLKAVLLLPVAFLLSLLTAAFTEEIFFRGILQPRLARVIRSEMRACLITAFLFGLYHLPYAYFLSDWATHGNFIWALSSVLVEQMTTGLILGILWVKTRNIATPILFHALVDTIAIMTMLPTMLHIR